MEAVGLHPSPQRRRPLPRQDLPVPRRRVQPRQEHGPDRGRRPGRAPGRVRDDGHRRGRPSGRWAPWTRSSSSAPRAPSGPTRPRPTRASRSSGASMPTWGMYEGTPNIDLVIVPAIDGNFDPATNELIPFERQFQFLHSLQNYFLTNELLAPGPRRCRMVDNDALRARRADFVARFCERPVLLHPRGDPPGAHGRGRPDPLSGAHADACSPSRTPGPATLAEAVALLARARPGGARPRRRDGPRDPAPRRVGRARRRRGRQAVPELAPGIRAATAARS